MAPFCYHGTVCWALCDGVTSGSRRTMAHCRSKCTLTFIEGGANAARLRQSQQHTLDTSNTERPTSRFVHMRDSPAIELTWKAQEREIDMHAMVITGTFLQPQSTLRTGALFPFILYPLHPPCGKCSKPRALLWTSNPLHPPQIQEGAPVRHGGCKRGKGPKVAKFLDR